MSALHVAVVGAEDHDRVLVGLALLKRLDTETDDAPWLTVCSFLNPHDDSLFGVPALAQGLRSTPQTCRTSIRRRPYEEALHVPFIVSSPLLPGGAPGSTSRPTTPT